MDIRFLIENSGPLLWPLIGLSIVVAAAAIERSIFHLTGGGKVAGPEPAHWLQERKLKKPDRSETRKVRRSAGGRILLALDLHQRDEVGSLQLDARIRHEFARLSGKLRMFDMIVAAAPLLGILGTVVGLVAGFHYATDGPAGMNPDTLAGGVAQSLATTVVGLVIALFALGARHGFGSRAERARAALMDYLRRVEEACEQHGMKP
jgi:biopolymer transport protein ExbB